METLRIDWTEPVRLANLHADPSGVQEAATSYQAVLLPGLSTVTENVRYFSLFTAARYYRMEVGESAKDVQKLNDYTRRLEALIAVSSILHHEDSGDVPPTGIVGREWANSASQEDPITLLSTVQNPPYGIYIGSMADLGLVDNTRPTQPLQEGAKPLAQAWDLSAAGQLGEYMRHGNLPDKVPRDMVRSAARAFCLCQVPEDSDEQNQLIKVLLGLGKGLSAPAFVIVDDVVDSSSYRSASWRLLLEIVDKNLCRDLSNEYLVARLLSPETLDLELIAPLRACLMAWRWAAARAFFERGWTSLFNRALNSVKSSKMGISSCQLRNDIEVQFAQELGREPLLALYQNAESNCHSSLWLTEKFESTQPRDFLLLILAGMSAARIDCQQGFPAALEGLWSRPPIPFAAESERLLKAVASNDTAAHFAGELAESALVFHVRNSLRKMASGLPDSMLVDFEDGRWVTPSRTLDLGAPRPASASSRLDIALAWALQIGLVGVTQERGLVLTRVGSKARDTWDGENGEIWV